MQVKLYAPAVPLEHRKAIQKKTRIFAELPAMWLECIKSIIIIVPLFLKYNFA